MKSAEEILNKTITGDENDGHWFNGELGRKEALQAMHEYAAQDRWVKVSDKPLFTIDEKGNWECTDDGNCEFIAAVPYTDTREPSKTKWWIRHCIVEDIAGLCVVTDDDTEKAGWELSDVTHWQPLPTAPKD